MERKQDLLLAARSGWETTEICYNKETDSFYECHYHSEYLDTGTVYDGDTPLTDEEAWLKIIEFGSERGIQEYLKLRCVPTLQREETGITKVEFHAAMKELCCDKPYFCYICYTVPGNVLVVENAEHRMLWMVTQAEHFACVVNNSPQDRLHGFVTAEEAYAYVLKNAESLYRSFLSNEERKREKEKAVPPGRDGEPVPVPMLSKKRGLFGKRK